MATNKASGLTAWNTSRKADLLNKKGERSFWEEWCLRHADMVARGDTPAKYHKHYLSDGKRITEHSLATFEKYLSAMSRAVRKYGSYDNIEAVYLRETRYEFIEVAKFIRWAPAGQRAKSDTKKVTLATAVTLTASEASKRLAKYPKAMRDDIIISLGLK